MEVALVLILDESIAPGFAGLLIDDYVYSTDTAVLLEAVSEGALICFVGL